MIIFESEKNAPLGNQIFVIRLSALASVLTNLRSSYLKYLIVQATPTSWSEQIPYFLESFTGLENIRINQNWTFFQLISLFSIVTLR